MGEPVVCLHGFGLDRSVMAAAMEPVLGLRPGLRRIYPDLPGHGESPAGPPDPAGVADAVSAFIDGPLGGGPVLLAGWSYGGYIAATLARRRPASVTGLLLICAGARLLAPGERELPGPPADPGPGPWLDRVPGRLREHLALAIGNRSAEVAGRVAAALTAARPGDEEYLERLRAAGYQAPDEDDTAGYPGPACILAGRQDRIGGIRRPVPRAERIPGGQLLGAAAGRPLPAVRAAGRLRRAGAGVAGQPRCPGAGETAGGQCATVVPWRTTRR